MRDVDAPSRIYATFDINGVQATYSATIQPAIQMFRSIEQRTTLRYAHDDDLTATRKYGGRVGTTDFRITLENGVVLEGRLDGMGVRSACSVVGSGSWTWN